MTKINFSQFFQSKKHIAINLVLKNLIIVSPQPFLFGQSVKISPLLISCSKISLELTIKCFKSKPSKHSSLNLLSVLVTQCHETNFPLNGQFSSPEFFWWKRVDNEHLVCQQAADEIEKQGDWNLSRKKFWCLLWSCCSSNLLKWLWDLWNSLFRVKLILAVVHDHCLLAHCSFLLLPKGWSEYKGWNYSS